MKTFDKNTKMAIQGDIAITCLDALPEGMTVSEGENGKHVLAHSETGHNHEVAVAGTRFYNDPNNELVSYLVVEEDGVKLEHNRSYNTHETIQFDAGVYRINRQREYTPEGFRRVAD
jgi:hypothetical protein